jgi:hypothetical protein
MTTNEQTATVPGEQGERMQAVVRQGYYDPDALAASGELMEEFERVHAAQPGYAGNLVVDLGGGERILVTLWKSERHAAAARSALGPVVRDLLGPLERAPSRLLGAGPVIRNDLELAGERISR